MGAAGRALDHPDRRRRDGVRWHIDQLLCRKVKLVAQLAEAGSAERAQLQLQVSAIEQQVERLVEAIRRQPGADEEPGRAEVGGTQP